MRGYSCSRLMCRCTHDYPCDQGWIEAPEVTRNGATYQRVAPCPVCRPELTDRLDEQAALQARTVRR